MKIRKGDKVRVLSGKDRNKEGIVTEALPARGKVVVEGVNTAQRHTKPKSAEEPGGILEKDMPVHASSVAVISPKDGKPTRVGYKFDNGEKVRICKRTGVDIPEVNE